MFPTEMNSFFKGGKKNPKTNWFWLLQYKIKNNVFTMYSTCWKFTLFFCFFIFSWLTQWVKPKFAQVCYFIYNTPLLIFMHEVRQNVNSKHGELVVAGVHK